MFYDLHAFYTSDLWGDFRRRLMLERTDEQGQLMCDHCRRPIIKAYDCIGHHKIELTLENVNDYSISLNPEHVVLVHHKCHNEIHNRWQGWDNPIQRVYLVWGSPCAGKSHFVKEAANPDDLIIDMDNIWKSVCNSEWYVKPYRLKRNVFAIYECLLDMVQTRHGKWRSAWIILSAPLRMDRERMIRRFQCEPIHIDTPMDLCLSRCADRPEEWTGYVTEYFDKLQC